MECAPDGPGSRRHFVHRVVHRPQTFNADFNHIALHKLWAKKDQVKLEKMTARCVVPGDSPQALCTGLPAFRAVPPQTYPQALLHKRNLASTVGFGSRGYPVDIVDGDGCRGIVLC